MGNWQLEVGRMAIYIFMPIAAFYGFHQVDYFESRVLDFQRKMNTAQTIKNHKLIEEAIDLKQRQRDKVFRQSLDKMEAEEGLK